jgi:hypothetical protein
VDLREHLLKNPLTRRLVGLVISPSNSERLNLVAVSVGRLVDLCGGIGCLAGIPQEQKHALAAAVVSIIPGLALDEVVRGCLPPYGHLFNPANGSGYIKFRISNMQKTEAAKNARDQIKTVKKRTRWTGRIEHAHFELLGEVLSDTFELRRRWIIEKSPTISEILRVTRLSEGNFSPIEREFAQLKICDNPNALIEEWHVWEARLPETAADLLTGPLGKMRYLEAKIVPSYREERSVVQIVPQMESAREFVAQCQIHQPYILLQPDNSNIQWPMLVLDGVIYPLSRRTHLSAFDLLFKMHYVCNVKFQNSLLQFLASYIYRVKDCSACSPKLLTVLNQLFSATL